MKRIPDALLMAVSAVFLGIIAGALLMISIGNNPFTGYYHLLRGGLMNLQRIGNTIAVSTTLILTGLSVAFAFRTGLFNIGAAGQMLIGGLCATTVGLLVPLPRPLLLIVMVISAFTGGALWGSVPGFLKAKFNVHEVVATIMMNWIAFWVVYYFVPAYLKGAFLETESRVLPAYASLRTPWMTSLFNGAYVNMGLFIAIAMIFIIRFMLNRMTIGFELKAVGSNRHAARYAGIHVNRNIILSMVIAGGLAGLAGATFYTGYSANIQIGILPIQGFDGIAVALLGANNPLGVLGAALFFGLLHAGKGFMNAMTGIPPEISDTIIATIIYFTATSLLIGRAWEYLARKKKREGGN